MALRLEVISNQRPRLGARASIVLGVAGGTIGRALDNDWPLPDPQRYLSGHHARVQFRGGSYVLEDTSTNGVFINDATTPQGRRGPYPLRDGDVLRMGEYQLLVTLDEEDLHTPPGTGTMARMAVDNVVPLRAVGGFSDDLGASLNIEALIPPEATGPVAKLGAALARDGGESTAPLLSAQQRLSRLRAAARARLEGGAAPVADVRNGLMAFCRGAGIDPSRLPMENEAQSLQLVGRLLREAIIGLKETLRAQQLFRDRYRIESHPPEGRSPLEQGADEYLLELLAGHEDHRLDAVMQLRGHFSYAGRQAAALDPALRTALGQFLAHLAPSRMEAGATTLARNIGDTGSWERYKDVYSNLLQATGEDVPHLFLEAIAQAFREAQKSDPG
jgi:type VI secretion system FHA domain protein